MKSLASINKTLAECDPKIRRGKVWCYDCGRIRRVDPGECFASGWPKCCGSTMGISSPEERAQALDRKQPSSLRSEAAETVQSRRP